MTKLEAHPNLLSYRSPTHTVPFETREQAAGLHRPRVAVDPEESRNQRKKQMADIRKMPQTDPRKGNFINIMV